MDELYDGNLLSDLSNTDSRTGRVIIYGNRIELWSNSSVVYKRTFGGGSYIRTGQFMLSSVVSIIGSNLVNRYKELVYIDVTLRYFSIGEGVASKNYVTYRVYPYLLNENEGYSKDIALPIKSSEQWIEEIIIKISTGDIGTSRARLTDNKLSYRLILPDAIEKVSSGVANTVYTERIENTTIERVESYDDGLVVYYKGISEPSTLKVTTVDANNFTINVSNKYSFGISFKSGIMPY